MPPTTSSLEMEWDYSGRKGRDGQKKKIGKDNERKGKVKRAKYEEVNGQGERGVPGPIWSSGVKNEVIRSVMHRVKPPKSRLQSRLNDR